MKKCSKCKVKKELTEFSKDKSRKDNLTPQCKSCCSLNFKKWVKENQNKKLEYQKQYDTQNKNKKSEYQKQYNELNAEARREYQTKRRKTYPHLTRWRDLLKRSKNGIKSKTTQELLGYSAEQLKEHLDKQGMNWDNHHIDHKIPLSWFKKDTPPSIVNDLRNLQPLLPEENQNKSNKFGSLVSLSYIYDIEKYIKKQYKNSLWQHVLR